MSLFEEKNGPPVLENPRVDYTPASRRKPQFKPKEFHPASRFIPPDHFGKVVVCFASGPGLTPEVVEQIRPYHEAGKIIAAGLNDSYKIVPYLDEFYACDENWWKYHVNNAYFREQKKTVLDIPARIWGNQTAWRLLRKHPHVNIVQGFGKKGFSPNRKSIHWGSNSGHQLLNLVWHMKPDRILLVGYNMKTTDDGKQHFFGKHPQGMSQSGNYKGFAKIFQQIDPRIRRHIINCTLDTALKAFEIVPLEEELAKL